MTHFVAVVQRGRAGVYETLKEQFERETRERSVRVLWDRRQEERRRQGRPADEERRQAERRGRPPSTWTTLGFILAREGEPRP